MTYKRFDYKIIDMKSEKRLKTEDFIKRYLIITLGCVLYAAGVVIFLQAGNLAGGGATGIALIINEVTGFSTGITTFIINVPLMLWGWKVFGKEFFFSTLYVIAFSSLLMWLADKAFLEWIPEIYGKNFLPLTNNMLINAVTGGALFGLGMGLIFRCGSSSGGTDIPVKVLKKKFRHISTGIISMISDVLIVACSVFAYKENTLEVLFFTVLSVVVFTFVFDKVLYGGNSAKMVFIVSESAYAQSICDRVLKELDAGATFIDARGGYTGEDKKVLLCVVKPIVYPRLRDIVREEDKKAFMIVSSAKEIYGEGYLSPDKEEI